MRIIVFLMTSMVFFIPAVQAQTSKFSPELKWWELHTEHFDIYYHSGLEQSAARVTKLAEEVHDRLAPLFYYQEGMRTKLILADTYDTANGLATAIYDRRIIILANPPHPSDSLAYYDDWLKLVIAHEYVHVLHLDMAFGIPGFLRKAMGRPPLVLPGFYPSYFLPLWMLEGLAVTGETAFTDGGRGESSYYDMIYRTDVAEDSLPEISQGNALIREWPGYSYPYIYGYSFLEYLRKSYGEHSPQEFAKAYASRLIPYFPNTTLKNKFGVSFLRLWPQWQNYLQKKYSLQLTLITSRRQPESNRLGEFDFIIGFPRVAPDAEKIYLIHSNMHKGFQLKCYDQNMGTTESLLKLNSKKGLTVGKTGKIYFSDFRIWKNFNVFADLFAYDVKSKKLQQLTYGQRLSEPATSPDGTTLACISSKNGALKLKIFDLATRQLKDLPSLPYHLDYFSPRFSSAGDYLLTIVKANESRHFLLIYNISKARAEFLKLPADITSASFSTDDNYIVFSADLNGVFNIYALEFHTGRLFQLSNEIGGAFEPQITPDGDDLIFVAYHDNGFELRQMPFDPASCMEVTDYNTAFTESPPPPPPSLAMPQSSPYCAVKTMAPTYWLPWLLADEEGLMGGIITGGQDALHKHFYSIQGYLGCGEEPYAYYLEYVNDQLTPTIAVSAYEATTIYGTFTFAEEDYSLWEREKEYKILASFPVNRMRQRWRFMMGVKSLEFSEISIWPQHIKTPAKGWFHGLVFGGSYENYEDFYAYSISPEKGRRVRLLSEVYDSFEKGDNREFRLVGQWVEYMPLPFQHQVLAGNLIYAENFQEQLRWRYRIGGKGPDLIPFLANHDQVNLYLRGYPYDVQRGHRVFLASLEWRFPLCYPEWSYRMWPAYFHDLYGKVFVDHGGAWTGAADWDRFLTGIGAEFLGGFTLGYYVPLTVRLGVARGLDEEEGITTIYLGLGETF